MLRVSRSLNIQEKRTACTTYDNIFCAATLILFSLILFGFANFFFCSNSLVYIIGCCLWKRCMNDWIILHSCSTRFWFFLGQIGYAEFTKKLLRFLCLIAISKTFFALRSLSWSKLLSRLPVDLVIVFLHLKHSVGLSPIYSLFMFSVAILIFRRIESICNFMYLALCYLIRLS